MTRARRPPMTGARAALTACATLLLLAAAVLRAPAAAQEMNGQGGQELRLLREAAAREAGGDLAGAEVLLHSILQRNPLSLSAILSLERILRVQNRAHELLPFAHRLLAQDATSAIGNQLLVRTYSTLDQLPELERAADAWIKATPRVETPYREIARVWQGRGETERALAILEKGRDRLKREDALALELGDLYAAKGDVTRAVREWDRAIGAEARGFLLVRRRLSALPDGGAALLAPLVAALARDAAATPRLKAAAELAIDAGMAERAEQIARTVVASLKAQEREVYLVEVARRAEGAKLQHLAYWAYGELLAVDGPRPRRLAVRSRLAELALAVGDTALARENYRIIEEEYPAGSPQRRQAAAVRIELTARDGKLDEALTEFALFRSDFPEASELDNVGAVLAALVLLRGELDGAQRLLTGLEGPRTSLVRGQVALQKGDVATARAAFLTAAPWQTGQAATETIALAMLLDRVSPTAAKLLGRALADYAHKPQDAIARVVAESEALPAEERAAVLDFAAGLADRAELPGEAERIRRAILAMAPRAYEAPAAILALARALAEKPDGLAEAKELLEKLILDYPRSALVPQARRELDRLQARVPSSD